ncbi:hypothetical protein D3C75_1254610 [compost metagenome]
MLVINRKVEVATPIDKAIVGKYIDHRLRQAKTLGLVRSILQTVDVGTRRGERVDHRLAVGLDANVGVLQRVQIDGGAVGV